VSAGLAVVPIEALDRIPEPIVSLAGDHPLPGPASLAAGAALVSAAKLAATHDVVLCLISGGASALAVSPIAGIRIDDLHAVTDALLRAGAPIDDTNAVRKHLDALRGGRLATLLAPARVLGLVVSDVPGDRLEVIASGPLVADPTTWDDVQAVLERHGIWESAPSAVRAAVQARRSETPKPGDARLADIDLEIVAAASTALAAAADTARGLGYAVDVDHRHVSGEARAFGAGLAQRIVSSTELPRAVLRAGETTVTVRGSGRGGRNQEVALGAVEGLTGSASLVAAIGTDGIDGPTDAAGALATGSTLERSRVAHLDLQSALERNDAYGFFDGLSDLIRSGPTGTNVMDLYLALRER
jgi:glycerate-2-kinase